MPVHLANRHVLALEGSDRVSFLQGLVSNDVQAALPGAAIWSAFLTPQGKYLADFFIFSDAERLLLDVSDTQSDTLTTKLSRFRLRSDVRIPRTDLAVIAGWDNEPAPEGVPAAPDPRHPHAGFRAIVPDASGLAEDASYDTHRLSLGLPDAADCEADRTLLLEANFDLLHGISWSKGCYMGQELTARTHYRGLVRRRLVPVTGDALPEPGAEIYLGDKPCGAMRSSRDNRGLAFLRTEAWDQVLRSADGAEIRVEKPDWLVVKTPPA